MKTFTCQCGNTLHFPNFECVSCGLELGFIPEEKTLSALVVDNQGKYQATTNGERYRKCRNYAEYNVCNWMVDEDDPEPYCQACRLNDTIPNLSQPENLTLWFRLEQAKRRLLYTLMRLELPIADRRAEPETGLGFAFLQDQTQDEFGNELTVKTVVTTGHASGLITINLNEADHSTRVEMREKMQERYRTLLGHFRHESGHYYWDRLIANTDKLDAFRELFGDERQDYREAMERYYQYGPANDWQNHLISAYASMHPWEDWAETWAHYLHMVDTLETAHAYDFSVSGNKLADPIPSNRGRDDTLSANTFKYLFNDWCQLVKVLNALNRSMGLDDAYPFVIPSKALEKLRFVHRLTFGH